MKMKDLNNKGNLSYHMVTLSTLKTSILSLYLEDYSKSFYVREIGKLLNTNHVSLIPHLKDFVKERVLEVKQIGRNKLYSLNKSNYFVCDYLIILEKLKAISFLKDNLFLRKFYLEFISLELDIVLFGSFANKTNNSKSDVDLLILGDLSNQVKKKIIDFGKVYSKKFHLVNLSREDFYNSKKDNSFVLEILKNHIIFSGVERFVKKRWLKWKI